MIGFNNFRDHLQRKCIIFKAKKRCFYINLFFLNICNIIFLKALARLTVSLRRKCALKTAVQTFKLPGWTLLLVRLSKSRSGLDWFEKSQAAQGAWPHPTSRLLSRDSGRVFFNFGKTNVIKGNSWSLNSCACVSWVPFVYGSSFQFYFGTNLDYFWK